MKLVLSVMNESVNQNLGRAKNSKTRMDGHTIINFKRGLRIPLQRLKINNQGIFHGKNRIIFQVLGCTVKNLRSDWFVSVSLNLDLDPLIAA